MTRIETLTSPANPLLRRIRRAVQRSSLTSDGFCIAESYHLLEEAVRSGCEIRAVLASESQRRELEHWAGRLAGTRYFAVPDELFRDLAATENSQGIMALVLPPAWGLDDLLPKAPLVVVLDGLQDPGNAGAILRAAEAFGATGTLFLKGTVSPFNPKAVRASAGSLFRTPLAAGLTASEARALLEQRGVRLFAAMPSAGPEAGSADLTSACAVVIGSEAHGISRELADAAEAVHIPTTGVESLNAAVAAGILLYEARRQRSQYR